MPGSYNLRSSQKKKGNSVDHCYLQNFLENSSSQVFHPKVHLERLKLTGPEDIQNSRFYLENGKIIIKKDKPDTKKPYLLIIFCAIILLLALLSFYWQDLLQSSHGTILERQFATIHSTIHNYYSEVVRFHQEILNQSIYKQQKPSKRKSIKLVSSTPEEFTQIHDDVQIRKIVRDYFEELDTQNEIQSTKKPSKSFIEDQCKNNKDKFYTVKNNFNNNTVPELTDFTDYALESQGAKIVSVFNTEFYGTVTFMNITVGPVISQFFMNYLKSSSSNGPNSVLVPWNKPGDCWAFKGSQGRVQIELSKKIVIRGITIDHIPKEIAPYENIQSAPRKFSVIGVKKCKNQMCKTYLGSYEYKSTGPAIQTFFIYPEVEISFERVEIVIESNHGNGIYTCVYKIRVHGY